MICSIISVILIVRVSTGLEGRMLLRIVLLFNGLNIQIGDQVLYDLLCQLNIL